MNYKPLQNGSDIRGVAIQTPNGPAVNLTPDVAANLAVAFLEFIKDLENKPESEIIISIGRDPRLSGSLLSQAIISALSQNGVKVLDAGLASTPAMFMSTIFPEFSCHGAIMITASHMPMNRNGMKFFSRKGGLEKKDIALIVEKAEALAEQAEAATEQDAEFEKSGTSPDPSFDAESIPLMDVYSKHLRNIIIKGISGGRHDGTHDGLGDRKDDRINDEINEGIDEEITPLKGIKITVDAGNGSGGFYCNKVLKPLGAEVESSQFLEPDGNFPNHMPNPEDHAAMESLSNRVREAHSDLGLIFDTDVDRASAVDENGKEIAHNGIVAVAASLIAKDYPGTTVVTDSVTSTQLTDYLEKVLGLKHLRFKRGYRNVIGKAIELNQSGIDCQLAIETSGHGAYKDNYFLDDGAYLATLIVIETAKLAKEGLGISTLIADLEEPLEANEYRLPFIPEVLEKNDLDFSNQGDIIIDNLRYEVEAGRIPECSLEEPNYEGVRINFNNEDIKGWALLRKSLHDPLMPLNIEASKKGGCGKIADILRRFLESYPELDTSSL